MRTLLLKVLEHNKSRYEANILWHLRRFGHDMDSVRHLSVPQARDEIFAQVRAEIIIDAEDHAALSDEEAHWMIRRKISAVVGRDAQKTPKRRRLRESKPDPDHCTLFKKGGYDNIIEFPSSDPFIESDFFRYLEKIEPSLSDYAQAVVNDGHSRPADLANAFTIERTDADYILRRLRRRLRDYLSDGDPPVHRTST